MRLTWLIVVGIAAVGCKDRQAGKSARATPGSGSSSVAPQPRPEAPTLPPDKIFSDEATDSAFVEWAGQTLRDRAPQLEDVSCKRTMCRGTVTAASETELADKVEKLQTRESLLGVADSIKLTGVVRRDDRFAMTIYVTFDLREEPPTGPE
jgi:hypothetical protein